MKCLLSKIIKISSEIYINTFIRKASLLEISSNLFSSCSHKTKQIECPNKNYSSVKNINSSNRLLAPKKLEIKDKKHGITVMEKSLKLPSYLRSVKSKIKPEIEFHKKMFKASQLSPDFQMKEDLKFEDDKIINEFITFGSSQNPSPITNRRNQSYENLKNESKGNYNNDNLLNCKKNRNNNDYIQRNKENFNNNQNFSNNSNSNISNNIVEIANSFLKSPFMQFIQGNHKNEEISQINALESSRHKSSRCLRNSDYGFNDITQKFLNSNKESHFIKKESSSYSNLIKVDQISDDESISSTFSMLPTNEELQGFFRKEFCLNMGNFAKNCQNVNNYQNFNNSENNFKNLNNLEKEINEKSVRRDRESDIGKIISVSSRRDKENSDK